MRITSSNLQLAAQTEQARVETHEAHLRAWVGDRPRREREDHVDLSSAALAWLRGEGDLPDTAAISASVEGLAHGRGFGLLAQAFGRAAKQEPATPAPAQTDAAAATSAASDDELAGDPKLQVLVGLIERMTGRKIHLMSTKDLGGSSVAPVQAPPSDGAKPASGGPQGWGVEAEVVDMTATRETLSFSARGVVETADGRRITLEADLQMSRETIVVQRASLKAGDALKDPLVINFGGTAAELVGSTDFDLDSDGQEESISFVGPGSGFLVFGANGEARPDDGAQLFGPATGSGYAELAKLDDDGNGWIDEGDAAFAKLGVWTKDASGAEQVRSLADVGVGAISLGQVATPWDQTRADGSLAGRTAATGIFLYESGQVGTVQEVDLAASDAVPPAPVAAPSDAATPAQSEASPADVAAQATAAHVDQVA